MDHHTTASTTIDGGGANVDALLVGRVHFSRQAHLMRHRTVRRVHRSRSLVWHVCCVH